MTSSSVAEQTVYSQQEIQELERYRLGEWAIQNGMQGLLSPRINKYIRQNPTIKQRAFMCLPIREAMFGGAAGPGKSSGLLMDALQYVDIPGYHALILRKSFADLALPGALMDRARDWLYNSDAKWRERDHTWTFPSGATLTFGFIDNVSDKFKYQSAEFHYIGFDELTQFRLEDYRWMFSRLRRLKGSKVPSRVRSASNPGGFGHDWVYQRFFVEGTKFGRVFLPARLDDNPHVDKEDYILSLSELDPVTLAQLLAGDWTIRPTTGFFQRHWFNIVQNGPIGFGLRWIRFWDFANKIKDENDFTAGALTTTTPKDGHNYLADMVHGKWEQPEAIEVVYQTACLDPDGTEIYIEDTANGTGIAQTISRQNRFRRFKIKTISVHANKQTRAAGWASRAKAGYFNLVQGAWITGFLDECVAFGQPGAKDDRIDATSGSYMAHDETVDRTLHSSTPRRR